MSSESIPSNASTGSRFHFNYPGCLVLGVCPRVRLKISVWSRTVGMRTARGLQCEMKTLIFGVLVRVSDAFILCICSMLQQRGKKIQPRWTRRVFKRLRLGTFSYLTCDTRWIVYTRSSCGEKTKTHKR
jgi:hypothetical protein